MSFDNSNRDLYTIKLQISTNVTPQECFEVGGWKFENTFVDGREVLLGIIKIESEDYKDIMPSVGSQALDEVETPLSALTFCLDGIFRVNPHKMEVLSSKVILPKIIGYDDFRHTAFGRVFKREECEYVEKINESIKNDENLKQLLTYYRLGIDLSFRYYNPSEAFLNFYKVIEKISWIICAEHDPEFKAKKEKEINKTAKAILNERRLERHSDEIKINLIKNLINKYINQKKIKTKDQIEFACGKLGLSDEIETTKILVDIRNRGGIAHSLKEQEQKELLEEIRDCRNIARKFILKYLITHNILEPESYSDLMQVTSGVH